MSTVLSNNATKALVKRRTAKFYLIGLSLNVVSHFNWHVCNFLCFETFSSGVTNKYELLFVLNSNTELEIIDE